MRKDLRALLQFNKVCKQIDSLKTAINNCQIAERNRIKRLKEALKSLEQSIGNSFSDLAQILCDENMQTLLEYKDKILELEEGLENKTGSKSNKNNNDSEKNGVISNSAESVVKLPKFSNFYGDIDS